MSGPQRFVFAVPAELRSNGVVLKPFDREHHAKSLHDLLRQDPKTTAERWYSHPLPSLVEWVAWCRATAEQVERIHWAVYDTSSSYEELAGLVNLHDLNEGRTSACLSIVTLARFQRTHVTTQALALVLNYALGDIGLRRVISNVFAHNRRSLVAMLRFGFKVDALQRDMGRVHVDSLETLDLPAFAIHDPRLVADTWIASDVYVTSLTYDDWRLGGKERVDSLAARPPFGYPDAGLFPSSSCYGPIEAAKIDPLPDPAPPAVPTLGSNGVTLVPFSGEQHGMAIYELAREDPQSFEWWDAAPLPSLDAWLEICRNRRSTATTFYWTISDTSFAPPRPAGLITLRLLADATVGSFGTFVPRRFQRTHVATQARALVLHQAFDHPCEGGFGLQRVTVIATEPNLRSLAAQLRLGFRREGLLRANVSVHVDCLATYGLPPVQPGDARLEADGQHVTINSHCCGLTAGEWRAGVRDRLDRLAARPVVRQEPL